MNIISDSSKKDLKIEDKELTDKINEYNSIFDTKNNILNINNIKQNSQNQFPKNILNPNYSQEGKLLDLIDLSQIELEYDDCISNLKLQLSKAKEERKSKEEEAKIINHRLILLKNQEQSKLLQLKKIKQHIDKIMHNRIQSKEKINAILMGKSNSKSNIFKKNTSCSNLSNKQCAYNNSMSNSQNNYYIKKNSNFDNDKNNNNKNNIENTDYKEKDKKSIFGTNKEIYNFKCQLIEELKKDEEEKKIIEEEIAKIEQEENSILDILNNNKRYYSNNNINDEYNFLQKEVS